MEYRSNYPQIVDGFDYACLFGLRPFQGCNWYWNCLRNMETLRLAADDYRPRAWVVPKTFFNPDNPNDANVLAGKTTFLQIQVKPGSYLYGLNFTVYNQAVTQEKFSIQIKETQTGVPLFDRPSAATILGTGVSIQQKVYNTLLPPLLLLPEPRLIIAPGFLDISVSNDSDPANEEDSQSLQIVLFFAEPKR